MDHEYDIIHRSRRHHGVFAQGDVNAALAAIEGGTFDLVILCAAQLEEMFRALPPRSHPEIVYASFLDELSLNRRQLRLATEAAGKAARAYRAGKRVLITCAAGRNRSGLVTALAMHLTTGCGGRIACDIIRARRFAASGPALSNTTYTKFLRAIPPKDTRTVSEHRAYYSATG